MKISARSSFWLGVATGVLITLVALASNMVSGYLLGRRALGFSETAVLAPPPSFPDPARLTVYGQADWGWSLQTLDGQEVPLSNFKNKVLFINFWATWCRPCTTEMPSIQRLQGALKDEPVAFLLVSSEPAEVVRKFLEEQRYTLPIYLARGNRPEAFSTIGVPTTFILNREGAIIFRQVGASQWDDDSCKNFIRKLL